MKTVIMAGGKGTRIASVARDIPKPMLPIGGVSILEREIACLKEQGFEDIIVTVSHLGQVIMDHFGDGSGLSPVTGQPFGVHIQYYFEKEPLGNAGALFELREQLTEDFLLLNADAMFLVDLRRMVDYHKKRGGLVTLLTHPNNHPYDSGLIITDPQGRVERWLAKEDQRPRYYQNRVNAGIHVLSPQLLQHRPEGRKVDLDRQLLKPLAGTGAMFAYDSPEYIKDVGTPERYAQVQEDLANGLIESKCLRHKQKAVFLDRDGTLNRYVGFLRDIEDFALLPGAADAVRTLNGSGYLAIVATNQPVIARGEVTVPQLREIHDRMETELGAEGAYLDAIYYCPHHPDSGFEGEVPELKFDCSCRKPKPGMLLQAAEDLNIDLTQSWMVGDGASDVAAGKAAGCRTALISDKEEDLGQDLTVRSLLEFTRRLKEMGKRP